MVNHPNRARRQAARATVSAERTPEDHAFAWASICEGVQATFNASTADGSWLFATDATGLWDTYLGALPAERAVHTCTACRRFIETFGGLVVIAADGQTIPAMWDVTPEFYAPAVLAMGKAVRKARVIGPFLCKDSTWGNPVTGAWSHLAVCNAPAFRDKLLSPGQAMAAARENFGAVARALAEFTPAMLDEALRLLRAEALRQSERFIGPVQWLRTLHDRPKGRVGENVLWRAVASAPEGYCHPRASVVGSLLEDIAAGLPFADIKARFDAKMHPLMYQRPQAAPTAGNIKVAEAIVEKLGIAPSLERRFARLDEVIGAAIWRPKEAAAPKAAGVFGHLKPRDAAAVPAVEMPAVTMTWVKFAATVLPDAEAAELRVPPHGLFIALTTAMNADAPPILKWDRAEARNPVAWYVHPSGSLAQQWGLSARWAKVNALVPLPPMWGDKPSPFLGDGIIAVLDGCADTVTGRGNALFPDSLKDDLHQVRATIEAYSRSAELGGRPEASACGYDIRHQTGGCNVVLRVRAGGRWTTYHIDRWD